MVSIAPTIPMTLYADPPNHTPGYPGLPSGITYYYKVAGVGSNGEGNLSQEFSATAGVSPLAAPTGLVVRAGNTKLSLSWKVVTNALTYNVYRCIGTPGTFVLYKVGLSGTTLLDSGLTNGTAYYYEVAGVDKDGQGSLCAAVSGIPNSTALPATLVAAVAGNGLVTLKWNAISGAQSYNIYRVTTSGSEGNVSPYSYPTSSTGLITISDPTGSVSNGTTYYYEIAPVNVSGEGLLSNEASASPNPPPPAVPGLTLLTAPSQLAAFASAGQVALTWNVIPNATSYNVYRINPSITQLVQTNVSGTSFTDTSVPNDVTYYYEIAAVRQDNQGQDSEGSLSNPALTAYPDGTLVLASPTATPNPTSAGQTIQFVTSASGGTGAVTYAWKFGDGGTAATATASHIYTYPGIYLVTIIATNGALKTEDLFTILVGIDLLADTNRDGTITSADEVGKGTYTKTSGAIFSVNYDNDDGRTSTFSDPPLGTPIPDGIYFNDAGTGEYEDTSIMSAGDIKDIMPLKIRSLGASLPAGMSVWLKASSLQDIKSVHIYSSMVAGQKPIWGGLTESNPAIDITSYVNTNTSSDKTFGVEGILFENDGSLMPAVPAFNGLVTLTLELRDSTGKPLVDDTVQMKVAPWLILPDSQSSTEVWAENLPGYNDSFIASLTASGQLHYPPIGTNTVSQWFMDQLKIGYTQRPGGPASYEVFRLPYGLPQPLWPLTYLMMSNVGTFQIGGAFKDNKGNYIGSGDFGGNLGALPPNSDGSFGQDCNGKYPLSSPC